MPASLAANGTTAHRFDPGARERARGAIDELDEPDRVSQDMIVGQTEKLELFRWFVHSHLE